MSAETVAMILTIFFCNNDAYVKNDNGGYTDKCLDGLPKQKREISLLSTNGNLVQIKNNEAIIFQLRFDGSTFSDFNFKADPEAIRFWQALADQLPNVCSLLPVIIQEKK